MFFLRGEKNNDIFSNPILKKSLANDIFFFLKSIHFNYGSRYGDVVLCFDGKNVWRKEIFEHYKVKRKKAKSSNAEMWKFVHEFLVYFYEKYKTGPLKLYNFDRFEADDVISVLIHENPDENHLIVSKDKDFHQLHVFDNVLQYDYSKKHTIQEKTDNLKEHIIRGDVSDGIPNILSDSDTFVNDKKRQTPLSKKRFEALISKDPSEYDEKTRKNYERNRILISLRDIPDEIYNEIKEKTK